MKKLVAVSSMVLWTAHASAQDANCEVKRNSFVNGGTSSVTMLMVNDGKPCQLHFRFGGQTPPDTWELVSKPNAGTVQFREDVAEYQPNVGFAGTDKFTVAVFGRVPGGRMHETRNGKFDVAVTVNPKP
jgi:hypothetical protein